MGGEWGQARMGESEQENGGRMGTGAVVEATANGLINDLPTILEPAFAGFQVVNVDDQGAIPSQFDTEHEGVEICSDRSWSIELQAAKALTPMREFHFATLKYAMPNASCETTTMSNW